MTPAASDRHQQTAAELQAAMKVITDWDDDDAGTYYDLACKFAAALAAAEQRGHDRLARRMLALAEELEHTGMTGGVTARLRALARGGVVTAPNNDEIATEDVRAIAVALGLGGQARPYSAHDVVQREILPALAELRDVASRMINAPDDSAADWGYDLAYRLGMWG